MREKPSAVGTIIKEYQHSHTRRTRFVALMLALSVFVGGGVFWQLRLTGISMSGEAYCGYEEHEHNENCIERALVCPFGDGHEDTEENNGYETAHLLTCSLPEHIHTEACYDTISVLNCVDGHTHTESCYETVSTLICDEEHEHTADCYLNDTVLICTEGHEHTESCYELKQVCICNEQEHQHSDTCYQTSDDSGYQQEENQGHVHTEECYEDVYVCGFEPEYSHVHTLQCYSNPEADIEYASTWERTIQNVELTGVWADDLLAIAKTQLGYQESTQNYQVQEDGTTIKGITRYGQWYGDAYGDWCAMFVSWCLNYAEISNDYLPYNSGCQRWVKALTELGFYEPSGSYSPSAGDIIFYDFEEDGIRDGRSDHVGIVSEVTIDEASQKTIVHTIEGNWGNAVCTQRYRLDSEDILGYCNLDAIYQLYGVKPIEEPEILPIRSMNAAVYTDASYSDLSESGAEIVVVGVIPDGAEIKAYPVEVEIENCQVVCAYDISIFLADGTAYEPETPLVVQINTAGLVASSEDGYEQTQTVYFVPEEGEAEMLPTETTENGVLFNAEHFSIYAVTTTDISYSAVYDSNSNVLDSLTLTLLTNSNRDNTYFIEYSDDNVNWTRISVSVSPQHNNDPVVLTLTDSNVLNSSAAGSANRRFRIFSGKYKNGTYQNPSTSDDFTIGAVYDKLAEDAGKESFTAWVQDEYLTLYNATEPDTLEELAVAYGIFLHTPTIAVQRIVEDGELIGLQAVLGEGYDSDPSDEYHWEYWDSKSGEDGAWVEFDIADVSYSAEKNPMPYAMGEALLDEGRIRCVLHRQLNPNSQTLSPIAISNEVTAEPTELEIQAAIAAINSGLSLGTLSIGGNHFNELFYYGNVARDSRVPFSNATTYANYLAETYINSGNNINAVSTVWNRYLYDLYDPADDLGHMSNKNQSYPDNQTYGDEGLGWPKDAGGTASSPFHVQPAPVIKDLSYDYLENNVDYSKFIPGLNKTAQGVAVGDANEERLYDIHLHTNATAQVSAPVAMVLQIQSTWHMFDKNHANARKTDDYYGSTEVGSAASNSDMANLYDIKNALLRFVDYMDVHYPGNNLVMAITDIEHAGSFTMFNGMDTQNNSLYVTNDTETLRAGLFGWDTFGNCEHVHYNSDELENAVRNLQSNLYGWKDMYGVPLQYNKIRKVGVIIGGCTEADGDPGNDPKGWACELPWDKFGDAQLNSVYGIRTNDGTPYSGHILSWLDYYKNNGTPFKDGVGSGFTHKYIATNEDAIFRSLVQIATTEMSAQGIDIFNPEVSVENYTLNDTVQPEFAINYDQPFTLTVTNTVLSPTFLAQREQTPELAPKTSDYVPIPTVIPVDMLGADVTVTTGNGGELIRTYSGISYTVPLAQGIGHVTGTLTVTEHPDKTTTVELAVDKVFNNSTLDLDFQVQAREDYIGSNNVYTSVDIPDASYQHTPINTTETVTYPVPCYDEPEVNVPIRFTTEDGEETTIFVGENVEIADLASAIVADAEYRANRYDQINGTLTYSWTLPEGGTQTAFVTIENGAITDNEGEFPDYSHIFEGETAGTFPGALTVTFTPEPTDDQQRQGVNELALPGTVKITVVDAASTTDFYVEKQWPSGNGGNESVSFRLLCNGKPILDENTNQPAVYTLNETNQWQYLFEHMPAAVSNGSGGHDIAVYSVEELPVPDGFSPSYLQDTDSITAYVTTITSSTFRLPGRIPKDKRITVCFQTADGAYTYNHTFEPSNSDITYGKDGKDDYTDFNISPNITQPIGPDGNKLEFSVISVTVAEKNGNNPHTHYPTHSSVTTRKDSAGTRTIDKYVIRNLPSFVLPETGGPGLLPYTLGVLLLAAGALMYRCISRRKPRERRSKM